MRYEKQTTRKEGGDDYGRGAIDVPDTGVRIFANGRGVLYVESSPEVVADFKYDVAKESEMITKMEADGWRKVEGK